MKIQNKNRQMSSRQSSSAIDKKLSLLLLSCSLFAMAVVSGTANQAPAYSSMPIGLPTGGAGAFSIQCHGVTGAPPSFQTTLYGDVRMDPGKSRITRRRPTLLDFGTAAHQPTIDFVRWSGILRAGFPHGHRSIEIRQKE